MPTSASDAPLNDPGQPLRPAYAAELAQLRLQVELLAVRVDENLERVREVLATGDEAVAARAVAADDVIDAMSVSLTARCYDVLALQQPVAGDLRFVVSVLRVLGEFERVGDLALRIAKLAPDQPVMTSNLATFEVLLALADTAIERYRLAMRAWATGDDQLALEAAQASPLVAAQVARLVDELRRLDGPGAVGVVIPTLTAGRALDRVADHASLIGSRLLYLITGDPGHLADEVR